MGSLILVGGLQCSSHCRADRDTLAFPDADHHARAYRDGYANPQAKCHSYPHSYLTALRHAN
ncbi:MAG: hypothetical protein H6Q38_509 [Chloroflexi bacterium]|nr:hypothetical protein [Chloroflexota bacterium]